MMRKIHDCNKTVKIKRGGERYQAEYRRNMELDNMEEENGK